MIQLTTIGNHANVNNKHFIIDEISKEPDVLGVSFEGAARRSSSVKGVD